MCEAKMAIAGSSPPIDGAHPRVTKVTFKMAIVGQLVQVYDSCDLRSGTFM
jgi:hypothetical protein